MPPDLLQEQRERLLKGVAFGFLLLMGVVAASDLALWVTGHDRALAYAVDLGITIIMALAVMGVQTLARRDQYEPAAWLLIAALAARAVATVGMVMPEKIAILAPGYVVVIVLAQALIGVRAGLIAGLGAVPMYMFAYANLLEQPELLATLPGSVAASAFVYVAVGGLVNLALRNMKQALRQSEALLSQNERARRELQQQGEQFQALAESSPTGIVIQQDGHLVYGNPRFAQMARCPQDDVFGLSLWDFFDQQGAEALMEQLTHRDAVGRPDYRPVQLLFKPLKGASVWCEAAVAHAVYRDREAVVANILDVSDRVKAQRQVQRERDFTTNIINAADAIIMALDPQGKVLRFNPAGERITGYTEDELRGRPYWERVVPPDHREAAQRLVETASAQRFRGQHESVWKTRDGEDRTIAWRWVAQLSPDGDVTGIIAVGIDVTQQRILERQAMATERLRALGQMAGGVAHDLNNTLAGILGPVEIMMLDEQDPNSKRELAAVVAAARRGAETVKRIQRFSQARTEMDREVFNLHDLVEEVVHATAPRWRDEANRQGVSIEVITRVPEDLAVSGSVGEIGNVLTNLIVNACEAMPEGGQILIRGSRVGDMVRFSVSDTGCGMSDETMAAIFDPFFSTKGAENSGLGLAISRGVILRHGGTMEVESELGRGTTFTVTLLSGEERKEAWRPVIQAAREGALRVLVVDDTIPIADFAGAALARMGHEATVVYDSQEALARLHAESYDLLLTDYGMEGLSGVSLAREARRLHPDIKTVIMTGWDFAEGDFPGIDGSLAKPFTVEQLSSILHEHLPG